VILQSIDRLFAHFKQQYPNDPERRAIWTRASAGAFGFLLGQEIKSSLGKDSLDDAAVSATKAVFKVVKRTFASNRSVGFRGVQGSPIAIASLILEHGTPEHDDVLSEGPVKLDPRFLS
jgi:hypothetical protein